MGEQTIEVSREVFILKNKILFSQDGKHIFLIFVDYDRHLWRSITLDSIGLNHIVELDFDFSKSDINGKLVYSVIFAYKI